MEYKYGSKFCNSRKLESENVDQNEDYFGLDMELLDNLLEYFRNRDFSDNVVFRSKMKRIRQIIIEKNGNYSQIRDLAINFIDMLPNCFQRTNLYLVLDLIWVCMYNDSELDYSDVKIGLVDFLINQISTPIKRSIIPSLKLLHTIFESKLADWGKYIYRLPPSYLINVLSSEPNIRYHHDFLDCFALFLNLYCVHIEDPKETIKIIEMIDYIMFRAEQMALCYCFSCLRKLLMLKLFTSIDFDESDYFIYLDKAFKTTKIEIIHQTILLMTELFRNKWGGSRFPFVSFMDFYMNIKDDESKSYYIDVCLECINNFVRSENIDLMSRLFEERIVYCLLNYIISNENNNDNISGQYRHMKQAGMVISRLIIVFQNDFLFQFYSEYLLKCILKLFIIEDDILFYDLVLALKYIKIFFDTNGKLYLFWEDFNKIHGMDCIHEIETNFGFEQISLLEDILKEN